MPLLREDRPAPIRSICCFVAVKTSFYVAIMDLVLYGCFLPVIGTSIGGWLGQRFGASPTWELVLVATTTFTLLYGIFAIIGEPAFWRHLFAFDNSYGRILQFRDVVNTILLITCLVTLASTIETMIAQGKGLNTENVGQGVIYICLKIFCEWFGWDLTRLEGLGFKWPDHSGDKMEKLEHRAAYMFLWAVLAACVAKLVYFNTLFTYLRAMDIFMSMNPRFIEDDDFDDGYSAAYQTMSNLPPNGCMEDDFARSVRNTQ